MRRPAALGVPGRLLEAVGNGGPRRMIAAAVSAAETETGLQADKLPQFSRTDSGGSAGPAGPARPPFTIETMRCFPALLLLPALALAQSPEEAEALLHKAAASYRSANTWYFV